MVERRVRNISRMKGIGELVRLSWSHILNTPHELRVKVIQLTLSYVHDEKDPSAYKHHPQGVETQITVLSWKTGHGCTTKEIQENWKLKDCLRRSNRANTTVPDWLSFGKKKMKRWKKAFIFGKRTNDFVMTKGSKISITIAKSLLSENLHCNCLCVAKK